MSFCPRFFSAVLFLAVGAIASAQDVRKELNGLRTQYENAVDREVSPLREKYLSALKLLKEKYTKAGDLESALLVDKEMKMEGASLEGPSGKLPRNEIELRDHLMKAKWVLLGDITEKYEFTPEGKIESSGKFVAYYQTTGRRSLAMYWGGKMGAGGIDCAISEDGVAMTELSGGRHVWTRSQ